MKKNSINEVEKKEILKGIEEGKIIFLGSLGVIFTDEKLKEKYSEISK